MTKKVPASSYSEGYDREGPSKAVIVRHMTEKVPVSSYIKVVAINSDGWQKTTIGIGGYIGRDQ